MARSRITVLTDAAIDLIAEHGMRGLTHRAVDARADVPLGSTSAYFRTREALIEGVVQRLADLDRADIAGYDLDLDLAASLDLEQLAAGIAALLDRWLTTDRRRTLARYACLLEATHRPQLRQILSHGTVIRQQARTLVASRGAPEPERRGDHFVAFIDGLLFDRLVGAGALSAPPPGTPEGRRDLADAIHLALHAATRPGLGSSSGPAMSPR